MSAALNEVLPWNVVPAEPRNETCPAHGAFISRNIVGRIWSRCADCAVERKAEQVKRADEEAKTAEIEAWQRRIGTAEIPDRFRDRTLSSYNAITDMQRKALAYATDYAETFDTVRQTGRSGLFVGRPGTGKTHLAVGIALIAMERWNASVLFTTAMRALRRVKNTWTRGSTETESEAIAALVFPDLLILDEVGVQFGSDTERLILFDVLNERYEQRKPCLLLSNLTASEVRDYLGERIFDRLREDGGRVVTFDWPSHRGSIGEAA